MITSDSQDTPRKRPESAASLLMRLDLAQEVLEGLDDLGVETRTQLLTLMERLEQQISDED